MTLWQKLGALFGRQYVWLMGSSQGIGVRIQVKRAFWMQGIYGVEGFDGERFYALRKDTMARTTLELSESVSNFSDGSILRKTWCPATTHLLAHYDMIPDSEEPTNQMGAQTARFAASGVQVQNIPKDRSMSFAPGDGVVD